MQTATRVLCALFFSLCSNAYAGFTWFNSNTTFGTYTVGTGQALSYTVAPGDAQPATNTGHALQGVTVCFEAYDTAGNALTLNPGDVSFTGSTGGGQKYTLNTDIEGYVCLAYKWATPWVTNQGPSSPWDADVLGHPTATSISIAAKVTFDANFADYTVTRGQFFGGAQIDPAAQTWTDLYTPSTADSSNVDGTDFLGTAGGGDYVHVTPNQQGFAQWNGATNLDPTVFQYDEDRYYFLPTGNYDVGGTPAIRSGTAFLFTHNGAIYSPVIPEPGRALLLFLGVGLCVIRRRRPPKA